MNSNELNIITLYTLIKGSNTIGKNNWYALTQSFKILKYDPLY